MSPMFPTAKFRTRGRPIHQHDAHGEQPHDEARHDSVESDLRHDVHASAAAFAQEHGSEQIIAIPQVLGLTFEANLAFFHEDSSIGDGQGNVDRLFNDDNGQSLATQPLQDPE